MKISDEVAIAVKAGMRDEVLKSLFTIEAAEGRVIGGLYLEAMLEAAMAYLTGSVGREAAYNTLQRFADKAVGSVIENAARHQ